MSRVKRSWIAERQNWTRPQQKERIMEWFKRRAEKGEFSGGTSHQIANGLHMVSAQNVKKMCEEMVLVKSLSVQVFVHRTRKDGSVVTKSVYLPYCMDEWHDSWWNEMMMEGQQAGLFDL